MDEATWRVSIDLSDSEHAARAFKHLDGQKRVESLGGSLGRSGRATLYAYGASREGVEAILTEIDGQLRLLGYEPRSVTIDEWLADESRWSSDGKPGRLDSGGSDWLSTIIDGLSRGP